MFVERKNLDLRADVMFLKRSVFVVSFSALLHVAATEWRVALSDTPPTCCCEQTIAPRQETSYLTPDLKASPSRPRSLCGSWTQLSRANTRSMSGISKVGAEEFRVQLSASVPLKQQSSAQVALQPTCERWLVQHSSVSL